MKKYEIRITNHAEKDLKEIFQYIGFEFGSIDTAIKQIKRIQKAIDSSDIYPESHKVYEHNLTEIKNLREIKVDNYYVFYVVDKIKQEVDILRVIYEKRDMKKQLMY